jgi:6,7-dimethyl-8-ribityllumazine synthase
MIQEIKGHLTAGKHSYAIVVSRFNEFITSKLLGGAVDCLVRHGAAEEQITAVWVPGTIEITVAAKKLAQSQKYAAVICLGAVIRGQTYLYDSCASRFPAASGRSTTIRGTEIFGVLTCDTIEQAIERAGTKRANAGSRPPCRYRIGRPESKL